MTTQQVDLYTAALARADKAGIHYAGRGTTKDGMPVYAVTSASEANRMHLVVDDHGTLTCDCTAAKHGRYCSHRAIVRQEIERRAAVASALPPVSHEAPKPLDTPRDAAGRVPAFSIFK